MRCDAIAQLNAVPAPYWIYPGQSLKIPGGGVSVTPVPPVGGSSYTVLPGDSLFRIALRYGKSMQSIAAANGIVNYNLIYPGQVLGFRRLGPRCFNAEHVTAGHLSSGDLYG